jgi:hypothetical protein
MKKGSRKRESSGTAMHRGNNAVAASLTSVIRAFSSSPRRKKAKAT